MKRRKSSNSDNNDRWWCYLCHRFYRFDFGNPNTPLLSSIFYLCALQNINAPATTAIAAAACIVGRATETAPLHFFLSPHDVVALALGLTEVEVGGAVGKLTGGRLLVKDGVGVAEGRPVDKSPSSSSPPSLVAPAPLGSAPVKVGPAPGSVAKPVSSISPSSWRAKEERKKEGVVSKKDSRG